MFSSYVIINNAWRNAKTKCLTRKLAKAPRKKEENYSRKISVMSQ